MLTVGQSAGCDRLRQQFGPSPLSVLALKKEHLLDTTVKRFCYHIVVFIARCVPALWIYGGTIGLAVCIIFRYRWGVLLSLTLYSTYTVYHCLLMVINSSIGLFKVWTNGNKHWQAMCCKELEMKPMQRSAGSGASLSGLARVTSENDMKAALRSSSQEPNSPVSPHAPVKPTYSDTSRSCATQTGRMSSMSSSSPHTRHQTRP
jgi:hypothetical protein